MNRPFFMVHVGCDMMKELDVSVDEFHQLEERFKNDIQGYLPKWLAREMARINREKSVARKTQSELEAHLDQIRDRSDDSDRSVLNGIDVALIRREDKGYNGKRE